MQLIITDHLVGLNIDPNEGDVAITSIDNAGTPGRLNQFVLNEYGYSISDIPGREILSQHGFHSATAEGKKPILFVVTVNGGDPALNLEQNLFKTLSEFRGWFRRKKLWIPLMGTGDGGLSLEKSYEITVSVINKFQTEFPTSTKILLSIPDSPEGAALFNNINQATEFKSNSLQELLRYNSINIYVGLGFFGKGNDQTQRFYNEGIWDSGSNEEKYDDLLKKIKRNDLILLRNAFHKGVIENLKIKGIGYVLENKNNGKTLKVLWLYRSLNIDTNLINKYRGRIAQLDQLDIPLILGSIPIEFRNRLYDFVSNKIKDFLPGLVSDSDKGTDYLDIAKDVHAFARVIAARSFEPPLAIALFGRWGSGKSFFMRKLREQIDRLGSVKGEDTGYCQGVVHIHFNAWSYIDANLWASIVTRIFEGLREYILGNKKSEVFTDEIEKDLASKLNIAQEEVQLLELQSKALQEQIKQLNDKKSELSGKISGDIKKIQKRTIANVLAEVDKQFNVKDQIQNSLNQNQSFIKTSEELKRIIPETYWENPQQLYAESRKVQTFIRDFFVGRNLWSNILWAIIIIAIVVGVACLLPPVRWFVEHWNFALTPQTWLCVSSLGVVLSRAISTYRRLQPTVAAFWRIKEEYEKKKAIAIAEFEQTEKALQLEIEKNMKEIDVVNQQLNQTKTLKAEIEYKKKNALSTQALYLFIERRSNSEEYQKHLGIVSMIRKDFQILSELFNGHKSELISAKDKEKFRKYFSKRLERIVLYIDDLDRCPEELVVQVVEAVNLLMAFPLFVVVVGVDPRWIKRALDQKHSYQFGNSDTAESVDPAQYLEKIFQIPFRLKDAEDKSIREMIRQLSGVESPVPSNRSESSSAKPSGENNSDSSNSSSSSQKTTADSNSDEADLFAVSDKPEDLVITETEMLFMQDMSVVIGTNPRAIKRFVNIFRVVKAHSEFKYNEEDKYELAAILFLLALPLGNFKYLTKSFQTYITINNDNGTQLRSYLQKVSTPPDETEEKLRKRLDVLLSDEENYRILQNTPFPLFAKYYPFVSRFAFGDF